MQKSSLSKLCIYIALYLPVWLTCQSQLFAGTTTPAAVTSTNSTKIAKIQLPSIFANNMVLQRDIPIAIWGTAKPSLNLKVKLGTNEIESTSGIDGNWSAKLPAMPAGTPYELKISGGGDTITFQNVAIGDVWFCAGQSNMKMPMIITSQPKEDIETANYPKLRFFKIQEQPSTNSEKVITSKWQGTTPKTVLDFSAVAYYFAREIHQKIRVPIGIIQCTSGETIEAWMSKDSLMKSHTASKNNYNSSIFNNMIAPTIGYSIKGLVWYKGETDPVKPIKYQRLLSSLIQDWRQKWGLGNFPCLCVQLPTYSSPYNNTIDSTFAQIREAQLECSKSIPNFYLVVAIDTAEKTADLHPRIKTKIGHRLAQISFSKIYKDNNESNTPLYQSMKALGNKIIISFSKNITTTNKEISGFIVAGADQFFWPAKARIAENKHGVIVSSNKVSNPIAARYAWADNPKYSLYGENSLPVSPFRTDSWRPPSLAAGPKASYWFKKAYSSQSTPPDIVILGNEQLLALQGADACSYGKAVDISQDHRSHVLENDMKILLNEDLKVMIGALPSAMVSDQLIVSHALFLTTYKPKLVAIALSPMSFIDTRCSYVDMTEPFSFFSKDISLDFNLLFSQLKIQLAWYKRLISLLNGQTGFNRYYDDPNQSLTNFSPLSWDNPLQPIYPSQLVIDPKDWHEFRENLAKYQKRYKSPFSSQLYFQMDCLNNLLSYLAQQKIKTVVFDLPLSSTNKKLLPDNFWKYYNDRLNEICTKNDADYISADKVVLPFENNELIDGIHLNLLGGLRWSRPTAVYIANKFRSVPFQELLTRAKYLN